MQARSILCSYRNQVETSLSSCGHTCTQLGILIAREVEEKEEVKNLLMWDEFFFHIMVDHEIFAYVKNKRRLARCLPDVFARLLCKTSSRRLGRLKAVTLKRVKVVF